MSIIPGLLSFIGGWDLWWCGGEGSFQGEGSGSVDLPDNDGFVGGGGGEVAAIGRPGEVVDGVGVAVGGVEGDGGKLHAIAEFFGGRVLEIPDEDFGSA